MNSIRRQLTFCIMAAVVALYGLAAAFCYVRTTTILKQQFDSALADRARALCSLVSQEPTGRLEVARADATMTEFGAARHSHFLQIWDASGRVVQRSGSLRGADLVPPASADLVCFWDAPLPDGHPGRGVRLRFLPSLEDAADEPAPPASATQPGAARQMLTLALFRDTGPVRQVQKVIVSSLVLTFVLLCAGTLVTVPLLVRRSIAALDRVSAHAARIDANSLSSCFPVADVPEELKPICQRLNDLLQRLEAAFVRERRFSADAAHELRTPIAELRALAEVSLKWPGDGRAAARAFEDVLAVARQMEAVVTALLALARADARHLGAAIENVDLADSVDEAWRPLAPRAEARGLTATFAIARPCPVRADRAMVRAIAANLLSNAVEYCPPGGLVDCAVRCRAGGAELRISNTNDSLTRQDLANMAEPFWRKDASRSGASHSGLGLALVSAYAKVLGAAMDVELSEENLLRVTLKFLGPPARHDTPEPQLATATR